MTRGAYIRQVNLILGLAGAESSFRSDMSTRSCVRSVPHALQLVFGLDGAGIVQPVQQLFRIGLAEAPVPELLLRFADERAAAQLRQMAARLAGLANHLDLEVMRPEAVRQRRRLVPIVGRLQKNQSRLLAGAIHEPAVDRILERHPQLEMRIRLERVRMIVEE